jgi:Cu2+-exporting ATPase
MSMMNSILRASLSPDPKLLFSYSTNSNVDRFAFNFKPHLPQRRRTAHLPTQRRHLLRPHSKPNFTVSNCLQATSPSQIAAAVQDQPRAAEASVLLDVSGMMCGGCVSRVKSVLSADDRVHSVAVNMLTETAAIQLRPELGDGAEAVAESLAGRLTECGFASKRRASGMGVSESVRKWKEMVKKKEELLVKSRNRVILAWTLVALCCGSHASHILHSLGIHIAHGSNYKLIINTFSSKKKKKTNS